MVTFEEFDIIMMQMVEWYKELHQHYIDLYREISDEEVKERFVLWDGEEPDAP
jgi:hypothetical protein